MKGNGSGDYPDMDNNKYAVTVDGTEYECTYITMFDGGGWGYLRFKLAGTGSIQSSIPSIPSTGELR